MVSGYAPVQEAVESAVQPLVERTVSRTQGVILSLVRAVRNLCDEHDLQCLTFLAGELGLLRHTPFCFSRKISLQEPSPVSLVLRDVFETMIERRYITWDGTCLRALVDAADEGSDAHTLHDAVSWLGALQPHERRVLTEATIDVHASGGDLLSPASDMPFRRTVARILGGADGADTAERRLSMVRRQLGVA